LLVYDPGPRYSADADAGQRVVVPYLRWLGAGRIDRLIVTHQDSDHAGGLASLQAAVPVASLLSSWPEAGGERCAAGQRWNWDGVEFAILHPQSDDYTESASTNHLSCVLTITAGGNANSENATSKRILLTADLEAADESRLLKSDPAALAADALVVGHHGSKTSSTPDFVAAVGARQALISAGYRNRFGHPREEVVARYVERGAKIWRTDRDGALRVNLRPEEVNVTAWRSERQRYWYGW
jgi:competence protein ComEC